MLERGRRLPPTETPTQCGQRGTPLQCEGPSVQAAGPVSDPWGRACGPRRLALHCVPRTHLDISAGVQRSGRATWGDGMDGSTTPRGPPRHPSRRGGGEGPPVPFLKVKRYPGVHYEHIRWRFWQVFCIYLYTLWQS